MKSPKHLSITGLFVLLFVGQASAQENIYIRLDSLFRAVTNDPATHFNGTVLIAEDGKIIYKNSMGYADIDKKIPNGVSTRFSLASLSKVFTAVAVMQLKEQGRLKLEDSLVEYLPDFPYPAITIRQLLSHTSGLPDFEIFKSYKEPGQKSFLTNEDIIPALKKWGSLVASPGARWSYSSPGMGLLALVVEKVSGLSFPQYVATFICEPAGLQHTYINTAYSPVQDSLRAVLYANPGSPDVPLTSTDSVRTNLSSPIQTIVGPGLVVSSPEDLLRFDQALYAGKLLQPATVEEMFTPVKLLDGHFARLSRAPLFSGLGWGIDIDTSAGKIVSHNGSSPGIATTLLRNLRKHQTVIVLENTDNTAIMTFGINAMNILNGRPVRAFGPPPGSRPPQDPGR